MESFIARQPIFDAQRNVYGYELFFRSGLENVFRNPDPNQATSKVMVDSFFLFNMNDLTGGKRAFINVPRDILLKEYMFFLPKEQVVVELLETVEPDPEVLQACQKLKSAGYLIAMDDFVYEARYDPLLEFTDFVKVDFLSTPEEARKSLWQKISPLKVRLVAEKVETPQMFQQGIESGYSFFQGYFFSKPAIIVAKDIPTFKAHYFQLLKEIHRSGTDLNKLDGIIRQDVALTYKLLRYINSAFFGLPHKIKSVKQALVLLGERTIKNWISFVALASMGSDKPEELLILTVVRARFCETMAPYFDLADRKDDSFLMGLFSLIDAFLDRPLSQILAEIPIDDPIKLALLGEPGRLGEIYKYTLSYEKAAWRDLQKPIVIPDKDTTPLSLYLEALKWGQAFYTETKAGP
jgi:EAL and modified HD-GYP domain-containing signal transduction protein